MAAASPAAHTGCVGDGVHLGLYRPPTQPHAREMAATHLEALRRCCCPLQGQASGGGTGLETQGGGEAVGLLLGSCPTPPHPRAAAGGGAQGSLRCMPTSAARELAPCCVKAASTYIHTVALAFPRLRLLPSVSASVAEAQTPWAARRRSTARGASPTASSPSRKSRGVSALARTSAGAGAGAGARGGGGCAECTAAVMPALRIRRVRRTCRAERLRTGRVAPRSPLCASAGRCSCLRPAAGAHTGSKWPRRRRGGAQCSAGRWGAGSRRLAARACCAAARRRLLSRAALARLGRVLRVGSGLWWWGGEEGMRVLCVQCGSAACG